MLLQIIRLQTNHSEAVLCGRCMESIVLSRHPAFSHEDWSFLHKHRELPAPFTALLNSRCLSETLVSNTVNELPFIGVSLTKQKSLSFLKPPLSLLKQHMQTFQVSQDYGREWTCAGEAEDGMGSGPSFCPVHQLSEGKQWGHLSKLEKWMNLLGGNCT